MMKKDFFSSVSVKQRVLSACVATCLLCGCLVPSILSVTAHAETLEELTEQAEDLKESLAQSKEELEDLEEQVKTEAQKQSYLHSEIEVLELEIEVIVATIAQVNENITVTELSVQEKILEIEQKQTEYDAEFAVFGQRLSAMQELNDGGVIAILSQITNLHQLLTFDQTLQDISDKNAEMLYDLEEQRIELEAAKADLEETQAKLQAQYEALDAQYDAFETTKNQLYNNYIAVGNSIAQAEAAQEQLEDKIKEETILFNEVAAEIQRLIENSANDYDDLLFAGSFISPLSEGTYYISQYFSSSHPAIDMAAPAWTPIYASASGYVTAAQFNNGGYGNYVLIYHGAYAGNSFSSLYAHMVQAPSVVAGDYVTQGQLIGYVGNTGNSFGNHLHYELWANSSMDNSVANKAQRVNPLNY